jgi:adenosylcobinamide-GDP ribazoletransferase
MIGIASELRAVRTALSFFTRLPLPFVHDCASEDLRRSATYFPAMGWLVGGIAAAVWLAAARLFSSEIASGLSLAATVLLTGAMHEDGLADACDGFGGGTTREKILAIMQDSRVGTFGVVGLVLVLGLKWQTVAALPAALIPATLVAGHSWSRATAITLMSSLDYAREGPSKARALTSRLGGMRLFVVLALGILPVAFLPMRFWWAMLPPLLLRYVAGMWFAKRIGGYTGDCLGALQQTTELAFLLTVGALA